MKHFRHITTILGVVAFCGAAISATPEDSYNANIRQQNIGYSEELHAMLKIQDSVYLDEGESAVLAGTLGEPSSWHWHRTGHGTVRVTVAKGSLLISKGGKPLDPSVLDKGLLIDKDVDVMGAMTQVGAGVQGWRLFVYNQKNPDALNFSGVSYFPFDPVFRVQAAFIPDPQPSPRIFQTSRGTTKQFFHMGDAQFALQGKMVSLPLYGDSGDTQKVSTMSAFFTDLLTGHGAYGAGRYLEVETGKFPPSSVVLDFNLAYNPNCARSTHFTCPIATDGIPLAIDAGERDPHRQR